MRSVLAVLFALASTPLAFAQPPSEMPPPSVRATGEATVSVPPDRVEIRVGVVTQAPTAQAAAENNARQFTQALADLRAAAGPQAQVRTVSYSLNPNYRYPRDGGTPAITGYTATNIVEVRLDEIGRAGKVVDAATRSGANTVQSVQYSLRNEQHARSQALREATLQARANAEAMAGALNVHLGNTLSVTQGEPMMIRPLAQAMRVAASPEAGAPTPMSAGTIDVRASVTLIVAIAGRP